MRHIPVLLEEILSVFKGKRERFVDCTLGAGGHARALLEDHPEMQLIGIDQDPLAAKQHLDERISLISGNFRKLKELVPDPVDGILFDLGVSSMQLDMGERGFSFSKEAPLDMRMDPTQSLTASKIVNEWPKEKLEKIFREYGELPNFRKVADRIIHGRPIHTTVELASALEGLLHRRKIHPATLVFQALRIAVNDELGAIEEGVKAAIDLLKPGGRVAIISFHSLEDRIVKRILSSEAKGFEEDPTNLFTGRKEKPIRLKLLTPKPITPSREEMRQNPRSRSAKLRAAEKVV